MKDRILKEVKVNDEVMMMIGSREFTGRVDAIDDDIITLIMEGERSIIIALDSVIMYEIIKQAESVAEETTDDKEEVVADTEATVQESNPLGETVSLQLHMSRWSRDLKALKINDNLKIQFFSKDPSGMLYLSLNKIVDDIVNCANENALGSIYGRTPDIASRLVELNRHYDYGGITELLKILLINMNEYSQNVLGKEVAIADVYFADAYIAYQQGDHQKVCTFLDKYLRLINVRDSDIGTIMYFAQYGKDPRYAHHPIFTGDTETSFKKQMTKDRFNRAKAYIKQNVVNVKTESSQVQQDGEDSDDIYLTIHLTYWPLDIKAIKAREMRKICDEIDVSGGCYRELTQIIDQLKNGERINELGLKHGRTQEIANKIVAAHQRYPHLLWRELLMILLLRVNEYSQRIFKTDPQFPEVDYANAYKAFLDRDVELTCGFLARYFDQVEVTDDNRQAYQYFKRYGQAYNEKNRISRQATNRGRESTDVISTVTEMIDLRTIFQHVDELVDKMKYEEAYRYLQRQSAAHPDNQELINRFGALNDMRIRARKFLKDMRGSTLVHRASRARFIEEDYDKAERLYLQAVAAHEPRYQNAILAYADMIKKIKGRNEELDVLLSYKGTFMGNNELKTKYYQRLCNVYESLHDNVSLQDTLEKLLKVLEAEGDKKSIGNTYRRLAECMFNNNDYQGCIDYSTKAIPYVRDIKVLVKRIVLSHLNLNQPDAAEEVITRYKQRDPEVEKLSELLDGFDINDIAMMAFLVEDDRFVDSYEKSIEISAEELTAEALKEQENYLKHLNFDDYDQLSLGYLRAALIANELNNDTKYYRYISESLYNRGVYYQTNNNLDVARSYYLSALEKKEALKSRKNTLDNLTNYYLMSLNARFTPNIIGMDRELTRLDLTALSDNDLKAFVMLLNAVPEISTILDQKSQDVKLQQLKDMLLRYSDDEWTDFASFREIIKERLSRERKHLRELMSMLRNDALFNMDCSDKLEEVKSMIQVSTSDCKCLDRLLSIYKDILECKAMTNYDDRLRILTRVLSDLDAIDHNGTTQFIERYFNVYCDILKEHLEHFISQLKTDYKPQLTLSVPITDVIDAHGHAEFSVTVANADNHATASHIELTLKNVDGTDLYHQLLTQSLKGGATHAILITLNGILDKALTLNPSLTYEYDNETITDDLPQFSIATKDHHFEPIQNPYIDGPKLTWENRHMFFGRDEMIDALAKQLCHDNVEAVAIYGQKRTGKSSIFEFLKKRLEDEFFVVLIDAASVMDSEVSFYEVIKDYLIDYLEDEDADEDLIDDLSDMDVEDYAHFIRFMRRINEWISAEGLNRVLIMIDEFTSLYYFIQDEHKAIDSVFMNRLKTMIDERLFKMAMIGQDSMEAFIEAYPNQFQSISLKRVNYLEESDALKLINIPIATNGTSRYLEHADEAIYRWFNGQPYYLQRYCKRLVEAMNDHHYSYITMAIAQDQKDKLIQEEKDSFFNNLIEKGDQISLDIVSRIAHSRDQIDGWVRMDSLHLTEDEMKLFNRLVHREVIAYKASTKQCRIIIPFFKDWLIEH